jgi:hypothetical protein
MFSFHNKSVIKTLNSLAEGERGSIEAIHGNTILQRYFFKTGIMLGRTLIVEKVETTASGPSVTLRINGDKCVVAQMLTPHIRVKVPYKAESKPNIKPTTELVRVYSEYRQ